MKLLAIESSGLVASVAILSDNQLLAEYTVDYKKTHSQTLLPMIDEIVKMTEFDLNTIDAIAVSSGPGSFTGLRIGSATAKGLGLALQKPIIEVPTLEGLAFQFQGCEYVVCPLMDARRNQVYTGAYTFHGSEPEVLWEQCAVAIEDAIQKVNSIGKKTIFLGDGVPVHEVKLKSMVEVPYLIAPAHMNRQRAGAVADAALLRMKQGFLVEARDHQPEYLRLSQAEREMAKKKEMQEHE